MQLASNDDEIYDIFDNCEEHYHIWGPEKEQFSNRKPPINT